MTDEVNFDLNDQPADMAFQFFLVTRRVTLLVFSLNILEMFLLCACFCVKLAKLNKT